MAQGKSTRKFLVQLSNEDSPETFSAPCGITSKQVTFTAEVTEETMPDCDDPNAPVWVDRYTNTLSAGVSGSGKVALEDLETWREWFEGGATKKVRVLVDETLANGGGYWEGLAILASFGVTHERTRTAELEVDVQSSGPWVWTAAAA